MTTHAPGNTGFTFFRILCLAGVALWLSACNTNVTSPQNRDGQIYFVARTIGPSTQIQIAGESGETRPYLESRHWRDLHPDRAPDGRVVFMSNRKTETEIDLSRHRERFQVFMADREGENLRSLTDTEHSAITPTFSPDGQRIAYLHARPDSAELYWTTPDGDESKRLMTARDILDYDWSPDGRQLAVVVFDPGQSRVEFLSVGDADRGAQPEATHAPEGAVVTAVSWSPDGKQLAYIVNHPEGFRQLFVRNLADGHTRALTDRGQHVQQPVSWSRDGQALLYASLVDFEFSYDEQAREKVYRGSMQLFRAGLNGETRQLTDGDGRHGAPVFSPDEQRIAYLYADQLDARRLSLRTMNLEGREIKTLHDKVAPESYLQWTLNPNRR